MSDTESANADADAETTTPDEPSRSRWPMVIVGLTTILAIITVFTVWARTQALDTDEWVDLSTELLQEEEVQEALSVYLVDTLYTELDVKGSLEEQLPEDLEGLAGPVAGALRGPLTDGVEKLLASDQLQRLWEASNRAAHEKLVAVLRGEGGDIVSTDGGAVVLDFKPMVVEVAQSLGLSGDRLGELPDEAGTVVVFESDDLSKVQDAVDVFEFLAWFLFVLVVLLYALAVFLAKDDRLRVLRAVGWSLAGVGFIVLIARALAVRAVVNAIVEDPANRPIAESASAVFTALLRQMGWSALIYGLLIVLFTSLMGTRSWATATRRTLSPILNASTGAVVGGTVVLLLVLMWWSPGNAFNGWTTGLTLIALVIGAVAALRHRTQQEFPDTTWDDVTARFGKKDEVSPPA